jgi:hypothetical protein
LFSFEPETLADLSNKYARLAPQTRLVSLSFNGSALERFAVEALPHVFLAQEAGASEALRSQAKPANEFHFLFTSPLACASC